MIVLQLDHVNVAQCYIKQTGLSLVDLLVKDPTGFPSYTPVLVGDVGVNSRT